MICKSLLRLRLLFYNHPQYHHHHHNQQQQEQHLHSHNCLLGSHLVPYILAENTDQQKMLAIQDSLISDSMSSSVNIWLAWWSPTILRNWGWVETKRRSPKEERLQGAKKKTSTGQRRAYLLTNPGKLQRSHHSLTIKCFGGIRSWAFTEAIDYIDLVVELGFNPMWIYIS